MAVSTTVDRMVYSFLVSTTPLECKVVVAIRSKTKKWGSNVRKAGNDGCSAERMPGRRKRKVARQCLIRVVQVGRNLSF